MTAILKRCPQCRSLMLDGELSVCIGCRRAWWDGGQITIDDVGMRSVAAFRVLLRLAMQPGVQVSHSDLSDWLWAEREDGGPATNNVRVYVSAIRTAMRRAGWAGAINNYHGRGWQLELPQSSRRAA